MSDNIPESISLEQLAALQVDAPKEEDSDTSSRGDGPYDGLTKGQLFDLADEVLKASMDKCGDPMIHKIIALDILSKMIEWHTAMGEEESGKANVAWLRDAGKLQAAMQLLHSVSFGPEDFCAAES